MEHGTVNTIRGNILTMNIKKLTTGCYVSPDVAKLLLRLAVGVLVLLHGIYKIKNPGSIDFIGGLFENYHLPAFLAYLVYIGEVLAPLMLIAGYQTRCAAKLVAITMVFVIFLAHAGEIFMLSERGGGSAIELQLMFLFGALAIAGLGAGRYSIDKK